MNTKETAINGIKSFLKSEERYLLITGTHQYQKHVIALQTATTCLTQGSTVLFRINHKTHVEDFLSFLQGDLAPLRKGRTVQVENIYLHVDTINRMSWKSSPDHIDVGIIYPIDSLNATSGGECVEDLERRQGRKIILVSWTDNKSFAWTSAYDPLHVIYDAEAERPDYHAEMKKIEAETMRGPRLSGLPSYAANVPPDYLIRLHCHRCNSGRWARLNQPFPGKPQMQWAGAGEFTATCLKCGTEHDDHYKWFGQ